MVGTEGFVSLWKEQRKGVVKLTDIMCRPGRRSDENVCCGYRNEKVTVGGGQGS